MKLTQPTDFDILEALKEHGRNVAANLAEHLDRDRAYLNTRMPYLLDHGVVARIGPANNSGLYEITDRGRAVLQYRDQYDSVGPDRFEDLVEQRQA